MSFVFLGTNFTSPTYSRFLVTAGTTYGLSSIFSARLTFIFVSIFRLVNIEESEPVKNRDLSRLIANLRCQIGQAHTTVFTLDFKLDNDTLLLFQNPHHTHRPPSRELVCNKSSLQCFYVNNRRHILIESSELISFNGASSLCSILFCTPLKAARRCKDKEKNL
jgi:hypothetical protein